MDSDHAALQQMFRVQPKMLNVVKYNVKLPIRHHFVLIMERNTNRLQLTIKLAGESLEYFENVNSGKNIL